MLLKMSALPVPGPCASRMTVPSSMFQSTSASISASSPCALSASIKPRKSPKATGFRSAEMASVRAWNMNESLAGMPGPLRKPKDGAELDVPVDLGVDFGELALRPERLDKAAQIAEGDRLSFGGDGIGTGLEHEDTESASTVVPAQAGTHNHRLWNMGPRLRGDDGGQEPISRIAYDSIPRVRGRIHV